MSEMNWDEVKTISTGEGTPFMKLAQGANQVRVISNPYETKIHWEDTVDGGKKKVVCIESNCPICKAGHVPQKRYQVQVIDRADNKLKILEGRVPIFPQIKSYAADEDYGDPTKYDLKIKKEGQGRDTKYTVVPSPKKSDLTDAELELLKDAKTLSEINAPKSLDDILAMGLQVLDNNSIDNSDWDDEQSTTDDSSEDDDWGSL